MSDKTILIESINILKIKTFFSSTEFNHLIQKVLELKNYKKIKYTVLDIILESINYDIEEQILSFDLSILIRKLTPPSSLHSKSTEYSETLAVEYAQLKIANEKSKYFEPDIYISVPSLKSYRNQIIQSHKCQQIISSSDLIELKNYVLFKTIESKRLFSSKKYIESIDYKSLLNFLNFEFKNVLKSNIFPPQYTGARKLVEYLINEEIRFDFFTNTITLKIIIKSFEEFIFRGNKVNTLQFDIAPDELDYKNMMITNLIIDRNHYKVLDIMGITETLNSINYKSLVEYSSIDVQNEQKKEEEKRYQTNLEMETKIFHKEIRDEDPFGTGGDESSSCIYD